MTVTTVVAGQVKHIRTTVEQPFGVEKPPGVAGGVARGKSIDDGHYEGDEDYVVVVGLAMLFCCFSFEGTPVGVLEAGLGLSVGLAPPLNVAIGRGSRIEYVEIDQYDASRRGSVRLKCVGRTTPASLVGTLGSR